MSNQQSWYFSAHARLGHAFLHPGSRAATDNLLAFIERSGLTAGNALELGCGIGATAKLLLGRFPDLHYTGVDRSEKMLEQSRIAISRFSDRSSIVSADLNEPLPFSNQTFDLIVSESVTAICDSRKVLAESRRLLKPGGYLYLNERIWGTGIEPEKIAEVNHTCRTQFGFDAADDVLLGLEAWKRHLTQLGFSEITCSPAPRPNQSSFERVKRLFIHLPSFLSADVRRLIAEERAFARLYAAEWMKMENWIITARV